MKLSRKIAALLLASGMAMISSISTTVNASAKDYKAGSWWDGNNSPTIDSDVGKLISDYVYVDGVQTRHTYLIKRLKNNTPDYSNFANCDPAKMPCLEYCIDVEKDGVLEINVQSYYAITNLELIDFTNGYDLVPVKDIETLEGKHTLGGSVDSGNGFVEYYDMRWSMNDENSKNWRYSGKIQYEVTKGTYQLNVTNESWVSKTYEGHFYGTGDIILTASIPGADKTTTLDKPSNVKSNTKSTTSTKITWKDSGAESYNIYRSTSKNGTYKKISSVTGTSYTDKNLTKGKTYYYKVTSVSGGNESDFSKIVSAKACAPTPSGVTAAKAKSGAAMLSWKNSSGADGYEIYMSESSGGKFTKAKTVKSGSTLNYTKSGLISGKTYYFKIRSYITVNGKKVYSGFSKVVNIRA